MNLYYKLFTIVKEYDILIVHTKKERSGLVLDSENCEFFSGLILLPPKGPKHGTVAVAVLCTVYECLEDLDLRCAGLHLWAPRWRAVGRNPDPAGMLVCNGICKDRIWLKYLAFIGVA